MGTRQGVYWDWSYNTVFGCDMCSPGCVPCYAPPEIATLHRAKQVSHYDGTTRWVVDGNGNLRAVWTGKSNVLPPGHRTWRAPIEWEEGQPHPHLGDGAPNLIFVGIHTDLFYEGHPRWAVEKTVGMITASRHIGMFINKRVELMAAFFSETVSEAVQQSRLEKCWLGTSAEDQVRCDDRLPHLLSLAALGIQIILSVAPMFGPVKLPPEFLALGNRAWVICNGQQDVGFGVRPMDANWARALRDQCAAAGVPFFFYGMPGNAETPPDLLVREFPRWRGRQ